MVIAWLIGLKMTCATDVIGLDFSVMAWCVFCVCVWFCACKKRGGGGGMNQGGRHVLSCQRASAEEQKQ
jgi:hypothetical protein